MPRRYDVANRSYRVRDDLGNTLGQWRRDTVHRSEGECKSGEKDGLGVADHGEDVMNLRFVKR